ncbi:MAG: PQQ-binding-like beta-propeller repeat protein [Candidatus Marinimicrobia bacterium]|nr:PQQ-binding-like beta-propeller repeat protein [Candidatus Neomarinimicrobiota bacterium]MCF7880197.1 PQQ-binding-like beta-propeller repeat protein [Candidatus Neomarinimicrobiota bacterium]
MRFSFLLLSVFTCFIALDAHAQPHIEWVKKYDIYIERSGSINGWSLTETSQGYWAAGPVSNTEWMLLKLDSNGNIVSSLSMQDQIGKIEILGGEYNGVFVITDSVVYKFDNNLSIEQETPIGYLYDAEVTNDGGLIIFHSFSDYLFTKLDSQGQIEWEKSTNLNGGFSIAQLSNNNYIIPISARRDEGSFLYIYQFDSNGNYLNTEQFAISGDPSYATFIAVQNNYFGVVVPVCRENTNYLSLCFLIMNNDLSFVEGPSFWDYQLHYDNFTDLVSTFEGFAISFGQETAPDVTNITTLRVDSIGNPLWAIEYIHNGLDISHDLLYLLDGKYLNIGTLTAPEDTLVLFKLSSTPTAKIVGSQITLDDNWDGMASGTLDGSNSVSYEADTIFSYSWFIDGHESGQESVLDYSLPVGTHEIELAVSDASGVTDTAFYQINVNSENIETGGSITSAISTIDDSLFFVSSTDEEIIHFDETGEVNWTLYTGGEIRSTTTVSGDSVIYVGSSDTRLYAFDLTGNFRWDLPMGGEITASPALDAQGNLYVGTNTNRIYKVTPNGTPEWNIITGDSIHASAAVDEEGDIYIGSDDGTLYALQADGTIQWRLNTDGRVRSSAAFDSAGNIYVGSDDGKLYSLTPEGEDRWAFQTAGPVRSSPVIDGQNCIYFGSGDSTIYCVSDSGTLVWETDVDAPVYGTGGLSPNGNFYIGSQNGKLHVLTTAGDYQWYFQTQGPLVAPPLITSTGRMYIGSDEGTIYGFADISAGGFQKTTDAHFAGYWPTFQGNNARTGNLADIVTAVDPEEGDQSALPQQFTLSQNFPNPFNPTTTLKYGLPQDADVRLVIYDLAGRKVKTLVQEQQSAGWHQVSWGGTGQFGQSVSTGVYFYRLEAGEFVDVKKMVFMK